MISIISCSITLLNHFFSRDSGENTQPINPSIIPKTNICLQIITYHQTLTFIQIILFDNVFDDEGIWFSSDVSFDLGCYFDRAYQTSTTWSTVVIDNCVFIGVCSNKCYFSLDI